MAPPITKVECGLGRGRRGGWGVIWGGVWAFLSCRHTGCFIAISQHLPWMANIMWRCSPEKKRTISTSMYCHLMPYFNCSLYNSVKSGPGAVGSFSAHMFTLSSKVTKAQGHTVPQKHAIVYRTLDITASLQIRWECGEFSQNGSG